MLLRHRRFRAMQNISDQLATIRQFELGAIYILGPRLGDQEQVVVTGASIDVHILAHFYKALGSQKGQTPITPHGQTIGGIPIHTDVACAFIATEQHFAKIFQFWILRKFVVRYVGGSDFGLRGVGKKQKLVHLMRGNITQDAAILGLAKEPVRARRWVNAMWSQAHRLDHAAYGASLDEFTCFYRRRVAETFAEANGINAPGSSLNTARLG